MKLKQNLNLLLLKKNINAAQLSRATHIPKNTLSSWLAGTSPRNINQIKAVCEYLDVSIDALLFGDVSMAVPKKVGDKFEEYLEDITAGTYEVILRPVRKK